jgi:hypothetical protein
MENTVVAAHGKPPQSHRTAIPRDFTAPLAVHSTPTVISRGRAALVRDLFARPIPAAAAHGGYAWRNVFRLRDRRSGFEWHDQHGQGTASRARCWRDAECVANKRPGRVAHASSTASRAVPMPHAVSHATAAEHQQHHDAGSHTGHSATIRKRCRRVSTVACLPSRLAACSVPLRPRA